MYAYYSLQEAKIYVSNGFLEVTLPTCYARCNNGRVINFQLDVVSRNRKKLEAECNNNFFFLYISP